MREKHPYDEFIPRHAKAMIIGSFPIGKFSDPKRRHEIKPHEFEFFFGGEKNLLWRLLGDVFGVTFRNSKDIKKLLSAKGIGIGDVIKSCRRKEGGGSDSDLYDISWNKDLLKKIRAHKIQKVFFTSKKVEIWFNRLFPETADLEKITLISPSAQSVRSIPRRADYQAWLKAHPQERIYQFILAFYREKFETDI